MIEDGTKVASFLASFDADIERHPDRLVAISNEFVASLRGLCAGVSYDIAERLPAASP